MGAARPWKKWLAVEAFFAIAWTLDVAACGTGDAASPSEPTGLTDASTGDEVLTDPIAIGEHQVRVRACGTCHQSDDPKDGILSGTTVPRLGTQQYPANLTPDDETGIGTWSHKQIVFAIRHGVAANDSPLCPQMARFDGLTDEQAYGIAAYLSSLPPVHHVIPESVCPVLKHPPADASDEGG